MKQTRKLLAMLLCIAMVLGMATTVFATETTTPDKKYNYEIYQIFTGDYDENANVLKNVKWGKNGTGTVNEAVSQGDLTILEAVDSEASNEEKLATILKYAVLDSEKSFATVNTDDAQVTLNVPDGYYLVKDVAESQDDNGAYTTYIVKVVNGVLTINRKASVPTVDKVIVEEDNEKVKQNEASIGDVVNYEITGTLPSNVQDYYIYFYKFTDTLSEGLTITDTDNEAAGIQTDVVVTVNDVDVTDYFYIDAEVQKDGKTKLIVACTDIMALPDVGEITGGPDGTKVVVTYTATLNENAEVNYNPNKNVVDLEYSNDPLQDGAGTEKPDTPDVPEEEPDSEKPTGKTPESEVKTYTTEIIIEKVDQDGNVLTGAEFTITGAGVNLVVVTTEKYTAYGENDIIIEDNCYWMLNDGTYTTTAPSDETQGSYEDTTIRYYKETKVEVKSENAEEEIFVSASVGDDGKVKFTGLGAGTYTITETVVPDGYNSVDPLTVEIEWTVDDKGDITWTYNEGESNVFEVTNQKGSTLPETGGIGTTLFYVFGGIMVLGAAVLLVTKKRMTA